MLTVFEVRNIVFVDSIKTGTPGSHFGSTRSKVHGNPNDEFKYGMNAFFSVYMYMYLYIEYVIVINVSKLLADSFLISRSSSKFPKEKSRKI